MSGFEAMAAALQVSGLSPAEKLTLIALASHANENGECWPGIDRLKTLTGLGRSSVLRSLAALERVGLVAITRQTGTPNRYRLNLNQYHCGTGSVPTSTTVELPPVPQWNGSSATVVPEQTNNKPSEQKPEPAAAALPETDPEAGAVFSAYQDNIGSMTPIISELIGASIDELTATWVLAAIKIAAERNVRNWSYIEGILKKWRAQGHMDYPQEPGASAANGNGEEAWQLVMSQIKAGVWTAPKDGPELAAIRRSGGWPRYKESQERELPFLKREFLQEYHHGGH